MAGTPLNAFFLTTVCCVLMTSCDFLTLCPGLFIFQAINLNHVMTLPFRTDFPLAVVYNDTATLTPGGMKGIVSQ